MAACSIVVASLDALYLEQHEAFKGLNAKLHRDQRKMAFLSLDYKHRVLYSCSCLQLSPLGELYFCRHCKVPRCQDCVSSTIDSYSCPHCFESAPLTEARNRKNRCNRCFQCPQCASTLTTRSVIVPSEVFGDQSPQKREQTHTQQLTGSGSPMRTGSGSPASIRSGGVLKSPGGTKLYFLTCTHCKWSTRDVKLRDKRSPMDFKDRPSPHQERITELVAFYKEFALRDKAERDKAKKAGRRARPYGSLLDSTKFATGGTAGKATGGESPSPPRRGGSQVTWDPTLPQRMAAKAEEHPKPAPEDLYTTPIELDDIPTLKQRFLDPAYQPSTSDKLWPRPLHMIGKKLHRCKGCDHILLKAEMNPTSIRFKIQQIAIHSFPQIRIWEFPTLVAGEPCQLLVSVSNPLNYSVTISFETCPSDYLKHLKDSLLSVTLPEGDFHLTANDDVADLLEDTESELEDDPKFIHSRLPGKLIFKSDMTPENVSEDSKFMFVMRFTHKSFIEADKQSEIRVPVLVNAGRTSS